MAYSKEMHDKARAEIKKRKNDAENTAAQRKAELTAKYPEFQFIESELAKTGYETIKAFSLPKEKAEAELQRIREKNKILRTERGNLLTALKLPKDYLDVKYTCEKCEDTGICEDYDADRQVSYGSEYCECYLDILKKCAAVDLNRSTPLTLSSFEEFNLEFYPNANMNGYNPRREMTDVFNNCQGYARNFSKDSNSLYFYGRTGLGKTHLSLAIANSAIQMGYNVIYGSIITFINKMEKEKFNKADSQIDTESLLVDADLLILDDLGAEFSTAFTTSALYNIINSRIAKGVPTIISSNLSPSELKERYPESIASRIIGMYVNVEFIGKDVRQIMNED